MAKKDTVSQVTADFVYERDTTNKVRFDEPGTMPKIGKLYLRREHYEALGKPEKVRVTIEVMP